MSITLKIICVFTAILLYWSITKLLEQESFVVISIFVLMICVGFPNLTLQFNKPFL